MSKNDEKIKTIIYEIEDIEKHIKLLKIEIKRLKEELQNLVNTDED